MTSVKGSSLALRECGWVLEPNRMEASHRMANPEHVQWLDEGPDEWNKRRQTNDFVPDFSDGGPPLLSTFSSKNLAGVNLSGADFSGSGLLGINFSGANFTKCILAGARFDEADLSGADFTGAYLGGRLPHFAHRLLDRMLPVSLANATIANANFSESHLAGVDFGGTNPSSAVLFSEVEGPKQQFVHEDEIQSIDQLLGVVRRLRAAYDAEQPELGITLYFRGEPRWGDADGDWTLSPSVKRGGFDPYESQMLVDLMSLHPSEFAAEQSALSKWVLAQHHLLKTRFMDVTKNPLVALFFASETDTEATGKLHIFAVPQTMIKAFNSDTVSVISNYARLPKREQQMLIGNVSGDVRIGQDYPSVMEKLCQLIQEEKPGFVQRIELPDLFRVFLVEPQYSSERIRAQAGAVLASAYHDRFERMHVEKVQNMNVYRHYTLSIPPKENKKRFLDDLRLLNVTRQTLFPGIDESAKEIEQRYSRLP